MKGGSDLTLHVRRIDAEGRTRWTVDTRITRSRRCRVEICWRCGEFHWWNAISADHSVLLNMRTGR